MFSKVHVFRVRPDSDLSAAIADYCRENGIVSAVVIGIIGSLKSVRLNYLIELPGKFVSETYPGPLEIVGAQGSVALKEQETVIHIHIHVASQDTCCGGHLAEATVFSTAEVMIGELDHQLHRYADEYTGLNELVH